MPEQTIPILPCQTLPPVLDFYTALGFEVTYQQRSPDPYAGRRTGVTELQFFAMKHYEPPDSVQYLLRLKDDVDRPLPGVPGRAPGGEQQTRTLELPRVGPLKDMSYRVRQFLMTDPGGNASRRAAHQRDRTSHIRTPGDLRAGPAPRVPAGGLQGGRGGRREGHRPCAASDGRDADALQLLQLLVLGADVAGRLGDEEAAATARARAAALRLTDAERDLGRDALRRLEDLRAPDRP